MYCTDIQYDILSKMSTMIIDEVSFLTNEQHSQLNIQLRRIRKTNKYMGGTKVVFCEDEAQIPPVFKPKYWYSKAKNQIENMALPIL